MKIHVSFHFRNSLKLRNLFGIVETPKTSSRQRKIIFQKSSQQFREISLCFSCWTMRSIKCRIIFFSTSLRCWHKFFFYTMLFSEAYNKAPKKEVFEKHRKGVEVRERERVSSNLNFLVGLSMLYVQNGNFMYNRKKDSNGGKKKHREELERNSILLLPKVFNYVQYFLSCPMWKIDKCSLSASLLGYYSLTWKAFPSIPKEWIFPETVTWGKFWGKRTLNTVREKGKRCGKYPRNNFYSKISQELKVFFTWFLLFELFLYPWFQTNYSQRQLFNGFFLTCYLL